MMKFIDHHRKDVSTVSKMLFRNYYRSSVSQVQRATKYLFCWAPDILMNIENIYEVLLQSSKMPKLEAAVYFSSNTESTLYNQANIYKMYILSSPLKCFAILSYDIPSSLRCPKHQLFKYMWPKLPGLYNIFRYDAIG